MITNHAASATMTTIAIPNMNADTMAQSRTDAAGE